MSQSPTHAWLRRVAGILACAPTLVALGACHHTSSAVNEPSRAERPTVGHGQLSNDELLRGVPGVDVARTGRGRVSIRIVGGLVGNGEPLYVIDGMPVVVEPRRGVDWLRPEDVAQIKVLKDPAETTVYGPRGVNGVIAITTKRAVTQRKSGF